ncbi:MAG: 16S rRNA (cytosine(1402)-N(4))-methyltransferase RsmH [Clostridia bacterium]|nr:16S rRNA (cytosine(1402)-N(4))-methyltransferase RsmH [Clostridia bacterium]
MTEYHVPVMLNEVLDALAVKDGGVYLDGTLGGGGHSEAILRKGGRLIALDRDDDALKQSIKRFEDSNLGGYTIVKSNFKDALIALDNLGIDKIDGALLDLGISSHQIDEAERGFSYRFDGKLDMRMDTSARFSAYDVVNDYDEDELLKILFTYGEEKFAKKIVSAIIKARKVKPINSTLELAEIIKKATPEFYHRQGHPAKKTFQAIRIEVNGELDGLDKAVENLASRLNSGGRLAVITFHSLEDRIIKQAFRLMCTDCICDKNIPICVCGHKAIAKNLGKIRPSKDELVNNSRSASATLRIIEKL